MVTNHVPSYKDWAEVVVKLRLLAEKCGEALLRGVIDYVEEVGEAYKSEPGFEYYIGLLAEARKVLDANATPPLFTTIIGKGRVVTIPMDVARRLDLRSGKALVRARVNGRVIEFRGSVYTYGDRFYLYVPTDVSIRPGSQVEVISITQ
mgnify:CR=1 FL=1